MIFNPMKLAVPVGPRDHWRGDSHALVTLVEYADFECPYCAIAYPVVRKVQKYFGGSIKFVFRNFPLRQSHPHAAMAAEAAEAAGAQGKYWEMYELLFENQDALDEASLEKYAKKLNLNLDEFRAQLKKRTYSKRVSDDFKSGVKSGVNGTPAFFINDIRYDGSWDLQSLKEALQKAIDEETIRRAI
jgi:protein-disulfide isomerase